MSQEENVEVATITEEALWYKDAVIYQLHVRTFCDSNNDGIGDFAGLMQKLDYLQDLGVNAIWLLPFFPSPLRDDGYDIANYRAIHPNYGTLEDFKAFLCRGSRARHPRHHRDGSESHFRSASLVSGIAQFPRQSQARLVRLERYRRPLQGVRIIFLDTELSNWAWDPVSKSYYWHRFFSHQPDLNYDNPAVFEEMWDVMKFWLEMGVDAFRLDAVPYLIERDGTNCENLPETHGDHPRVAQTPGRVVSRQNAARGSESMAGGRARLFRRRR